MQSAANISAIEKSLPTASESSTSQEFVPTQEEIDLFQKNIHAPQATEASFTDQIIGKFSEVSHDVGIKKQDYEEKLDKAAKTGDQNDVLEATRAMGDYQLQVMLSTKVASKAGQAIEKLTNLQ